MVLCKHQIIARMTACIHKWWHNERIMQCLCWASFKSLRHFLLASPQTIPVFDHQRPRSEGYEGFQRGSNVFVNKKHANHTFFSLYCIPVPTSRNRWHIFHKILSKGRLSDDSPKSGGFASTAQMVRAIHCQFTCWSFNWGQYLTLNLLLAVAVCENKNTQMT